MESEHGPQARRLHGIQYLRAVAALAVVGAHATDRLHYLGLGVELFFVLSGFLMVAITGEESRPGRFLADRVIRIVPLYWIVTAAMLAVQASGLFWPARIDGSHVAASFLFIPAVSPGDGRILPLVAQGWTLNYEMLFYLLFAATLLLPRRRQVAALTVLLGALVAAGMVFRPAGAILYTWTSPFALEFLAGAWVGLAWQRKRPLWPFLPVMAAAAALLFPLLAWPEFGRVLGGCIVLSLLIAVLMCERRPGGVPEYRLPLLLGDASYSIYLWQGLVLMAATFAGTRFGVPAAVEGAGFAAAAVVWGVAAYLLIERPLLRAARRKRDRRGVAGPSEA